MTWTPKIEKKARQLNVKVIKTTVGGKHQASLVAFEPAAKQRVAQLIAECYAVEEETKGQASVIPDLNEGKPDDDIEENHTIWNPQDEPDNPKDGPEP